MKKLKILSTLTMALLFYSGLVYSSPEGDELDVTIRVMDADLDDSHDVTHDIDLPGHDDGKEHDDDDDGKRHDDVDHDQDDVNDDQDDVNDDQDDANEDHDDANEDHHDGNDGAGDTDGQDTEGTPGT